MSILSGQETANSEHSRITADLRRRIGEGHWLPGAVIPGRRHLAAEYGVAPGTLERAIIPLLAEGILRADDRRGTFVADSVGALKASAKQPAPAFDSQPASGHDGGTIGIVGSLYGPGSLGIGQNDHWIREIVSAMEHVFAEAGRHTNLFNRVPHLAAGPVPLEESLREACSEPGLAGLAIISFDLEPSVVENAYRVVEGRSFPVVSVLAGALSLPVPHVLYDNHRDGYLAADHLLRQGYRKITVLSPDRAGWAEERLDGIRAAAARAGLTPADVTVLRGADLPWRVDDDPMEHAEDAIELELRGGWKPDGPIICASDMVAIVLMDMLAEHGYAVGSEIPIIGFDDHELSRVKGLSTMRPPLHAMGREAARLILAGMEGKSDGRQVRLCSRLIPRRSTAPGRGLEMASGPRLGASPPARTALIG